jgi:hypothetical protein
VEPSPEPNTAELDHPEAPALGAVVGVQLLEEDDAVRDALHLEVVVLARHVVEEEDRAVPPAEELLESEDLSPVAQRVPREQPQLRERVEHDPRRPDPLDLLEDRPGRLAELHFGGMEEGVLVVGPEVSSEGTSSRMWIPSSVQPWETAMARSSSADSESVT